LLEGFYLGELRILNRGKTIFDVKFIDEQQEISKKVFTTVIIGTNGAGKSYLLTLISEVFRAIENRKRNREYSLKYEYYYLKYYINSVCFTVEIYKKRFNFFKNGISISLDEVELPLKVLAVSFMVNDKFVFKADDKDANDVYEYLGVRRTSNATWTNSIVRKVSEALIENARKEGFYKKVKEILKFLNFKPQITLVFEPVRKTLFTRKISSNTIEARIERIKKSEEYRALSINKLQKNEVLELVTFINETSKDRLKVNINNKIGIQYSIDLSNTNNIEQLQSDYKIIKRLIDLKLLNPPTLMLYKEDEFEFEFASSGEKQFLFTMINIASKLEQNSLILIDEPELSFHPNWQMLYINYLKKIFSDYPTCHFILATHSHYIISDLEQDSSSIVILSITKDKERPRTAELVTYSTYAWSAENVLYNIFRVRTTRNYYFEMDLRKLVNMITHKSRDLEQLEMLINKLKQFSFDDLDPINLIIEEAERYLENVIKAD
jgi:predicted ATPase